MIPILLNLSLLFFSFNLNADPQNLVRFLMIAAAERNVSLGPLGSSNQSIQCWAVD